jgi:AcrR family transcriptional regulator
MSLVSEKQPSQSALGVREAQRLETRTRIFDAAVAEISRSGMADADVSSIVAAAGVARGTFYFHFPTKEHVVAELVCAEEARIVAKLGSPEVRAKDLSALLTQLVRHVLEAENRLGPIMFRDMLGIHFSSSRPLDDELREHPLAVFAISAIADAQAAGQVRRDADAGELGVIFMTGLFSLLATAEPAARAGILNQYVKVLVTGMESQ